MERDRNVVFAGEIPENYDRYLGPVIFDPYAEDLVSRLAEKKLQRVLEVACGTGIVTRRLRDAFVRRSCLSVRLHVCSRQIRSDARGGACAA